MADVRQPDVRQPDVRQTEELLPGRHGTACASSIKIKEGFSENRLPVVMLAALHAPQGLTEKWGHH